MVCSVKTKLQLRALSARMDMSMSHKNERSQWRYRLPRWERLSKSAVSFQSLKYSRLYVLYNQFPQCLLAVLYFLAYLPSTYNIW